MNILNIFALETVFIAIVFGTTMLNTSNISNDMDGIQSHNDSNQPYQLSRAKRLAIDYRCCCCEIMPCCCCPTIPIKPKPLPIVREKIFCCQPPPICIQPPPIFYKQVVRYNVENVMLKPEEVRNMNGACMCGACNIRRKRAIRRRRAVITINTVNDE